MRRKRIAALLLAGVMVLAMTACGGDGDKDGAKELVQVGEQPPITQGELDQYLALNALSQGVDLSMYPEETQAQLSAAMLDDMVSLELMELYYDEEGTKVLPDDYETQLNSFLDDAKNSTSAAVFIKDNNITEEALTNFFKRSFYINQFYQDLEEQMPAETSQEEVTASHILLKFKTEAEESDQAAREKYNEELKTKIDGIYQQLLDGADFAKLAEEESEDTASAVSGGALGTFGKGMMVKEFEDVAFATEPGSFSKPFQSDYGYHIVKVDKHETVSRPFAELFPTTQNQMMVEAYNKKISELTEKYGVKWLDADAEKAVEEVKKSVS